MSIATVVTRGFGSFGSVNLVPTKGYSSSSPKPGRIEFTIPRSAVEFTIPNGILDFTLPRSMTEFTQ